MTTPSERHARDRLEVAVANARRDVQPSRATVESVAVDAVVKELRAHPELIEALRLVPS